MNDDPMRACAGMPLGAVGLDASPILAEIWRGEILESVHRGAAAVCRPDGSLVESWGDPARIILPRSACKMIQALPLIESGAAARAGLDRRHIAFAAASHQGAAEHTALARDWLATLGLGDDDLRCGAHPPYDSTTRAAMRAADERPCQVHNNCSGKHCGFLTLGAHLGGGAEYVEIDHPVQRAVRDVMAECCGEEPAGHAIDGCSAPNFAVSLRAFAAALARFARPEDAFAGARAEAARTIRDAMAAHPFLIAGEGKAATLLTRASGGGAVVKSGAEGVFAAILPEQALGIAVKIDDGTTRAAEAAIAALIARYGAIGRDDPTCRAFADSPVLNVRGLAHGHMRAASTLTD